MYTKAQIDAFLKIILGEPLSPEERELIDGLVANGDIVWKPGKSPTVADEQARVFPRAPQADGPPRPA